MNRQAASIAATQYLATLSFDEDGQLPTREIVQTPGSFPFGVEIDPTQVPAEVIELLRFASREANGNDETGDWCRLCRRATDHGGEHSDKQYLQFLV